MRQVQFLTIGCNVKGLMHISYPWDPSQSSWLHNPVAWRFHAFPTFKGMTCSFVIKASTHHKKTHQDRIEITLFDLQPILTIEVATIPVGFALPLRSTSIPTRKECTIWLHRSESWQFVPISNNKPFTLANKGQGLCPDVISGDLLGAGITWGQNSQRPNSQSGERVATVFPLCSNLPHEGVVPFQFRCYGMLSWFHPGIPDIP